MRGVELSEEGRAQAIAVARSLGTRPLRAVVSSPLERAVQTAAPLATRLGLEVTVHRGLEEIDFGAWSGRAFAELEGDPAWRHWNGLRSASRCSGGETMLETQARALAVLLELRAAYPDGEVAVIGHQDVLKALLTHALGMPLDFLHRIALDPAHRSVLVMSESEMRVEALNLPAAVVTERA